MKVNLDSLRTLACGLFVGVMAVSVPVMAQDEPMVDPPEERSTLDSIRFDPVGEEQLGETTIKGALSPPAAGPTSENVETQVQPVFMSDDLRGSLGLDPDDARTQRSLLFGIERDLAPRASQVRFPAFRNRTYSPSSSTSTTVRE